jgi:Ca2+-binding EF-hand superfamily protein
LLTSWFYSRYDSDGGGSLDSHELKKVVRGSMRVGRQDLSDGDLEAFVATLDVDGSGSLEFMEILAFVEPSKVLRGARWVFRSIRTATQQRGGG